MVQYPPSPRAIQLPDFMPFLWLSLALLSGIFLADNFHLPAWVWATGWGICLALWLISHLIKHGWGNFFRKPVLSRLSPVILALLFFSGAWRFQAAQITPHPSHVAWYNEKGVVQLSGIIILPVGERDNFTYLTVEVDSLSAPEFDPNNAYPSNVHGKVLVQILSGRGYHYGQRISLRGKLQSPPEGTDFSYREYLERKGILSLMAYPQVKVTEEHTGSPMLSAIYQLKEHSRETLNKIFPSPEAELLSGILLGDDNGLSTSLKAAYQLSGTAHIIAISGFNIALLASIITSLSHRLLGARKGSLFVIVFLTIYTILVGAEASVVRAAIMGSMGMIGALVGRRNNGLNTLGLTALVMCLLNPNLPWDVGFQLSFLATLGLVIYSQPLESRLIDWLNQRLKPEIVSRLASPLSDYLLLTLIAQVMVLPLIAYHFGQLSWLFLLANPLILPVQPLVMILGGLALLAGLIAPGAGRILAYLAWPFAAYTNRIVLWLAGLFPNSSAVGKFNLFWILLYFSILAMISFTKDWKKLSKKVMQPTTALIGLGCGVITLWSLVFSMPDGKLSIIQLPAAEQPVVLIQTPGGRSVLVNAATRPSSLREELSRFLPFGNHALDAVIIPSCKRADVTGLIDLSDHIPIESVYWACDPERIQTTRSLYQSFTQAGIKQQGVFTGDVLDLGEGAFLTILDISIDTQQISVSWQQFSTLLVMGSAEHFSAEDMLTYNLWVLPNDIPLPQATPALLYTRSDGWTKVQSDGTRVWFTSSSRSE